MNKGTVASNLFVFYSSSNHLAWLMRRMLPRLNPMSYPRQADAESGSRLDQCFVQFNFLNGGDLENGTLMNINFSP